MSASFGVVGRAQLAGYAGTASGILRSRIHPLVPIAAIDVLAVAVALGAMNIVGTMVGGHQENPFISALDRSKDDFTTFAVRAPMPAPVVARPAAVAEVLAAVPDAELLFAPPVFIGGPFEAGQGDTVRFISPMDVAATNANEPTTGAAGQATGEEVPQPTDVAVVEEPLLPDPEVTDTDPQSPPVAKILNIAGRTQTRAVELADQAVVTPLVEVVDDVVPLNVNLGAASAVVTSTTSAAVPVVNNAASTVVAPVVQAAAAPVQAVTAPVQSVAAPAVQSAAAPVQQIVQSVTQPVAQVVGGLLN